MIPRVALPWTGKQHRLFAAICKGGATRSSGPSKEDACRMMGESVKKKKKKYKVPKKKIKLPKAY